ARGDLVEELPVLDAHDGDAQAGLDPELVQERRRILDLLRPAYGLVAEVEHGLALRPLQVEGSPARVHALQVLERHLEAEVAFAAEDHVRLLTTRLARRGGAPHPCLAGRFEAHGPECY